MNMSESKTSVVGRAAKAQLRGDLPTDALSEAKTVLQASVLELCLVKPILDAIIGITLKLTMLAGEASDKILSTALSLSQLFFDETELGLEFDVAASEVVDILHR